MGHTPPPGHLTNLADNGILISMVNRDRLSHSSQRRPRKAHSSQRRPTKAHKDEKGPKRRQTRHLGRRCVFFLMYFLFLIIFNYYCTISINSSGGVTCDQLDEISPPASQHA